MDVSLCGWRTLLCFVCCRFWFSVFTSSPKLCQQSCRCGERRHLPLWMCVCVCFMMPAHDLAWVWASDWSNTLCCKIFFKSESVFRLFLGFLIKPEYLLKSDQIVSVALWIEVRHARFDIMTTSGDFVIYVEVCVFSLSINLFIVFLLMYYLFSL